MKPSLYNGVIFFFCGLLFPMVMTGCNSEAIHKAVPAHIVNVTDSSREELQQVVSSALNLESIMLASDALTKSNVLIIERKSRKGLGYELEKPKVFRLLKSGMQCVLVYQGTSKQWILQESQCKSTSVN